MKMQNEIPILTNTCVGCRRRDKLNIRLAERIDELDEQIKNLKKHLSPKLKKRHLVSRSNNWLEKRY